MNCVGHVFTHFPLRYRQAHPDLHGTQLPIGTNTKFIPQQYHSIGGPVSFFQTTQALEHISQWIEL